MINNLQYNFYADKIESNEYQHSIITCENLQMPTFQWSKETL